MKKIIILLLIFCQCSSAQNTQIYKDLYKGFTLDFENTHSLSLPDWGLYSKKYNGISHIPDVTSGMRWDVSLHPAYHLRRQSFPANIMHESAYHLWEAAPDLSYYSCRYELEWKDKVYCDVSFSEIDRNSRYIRAEFVNNTSLNQDVVLNLFANINYPPLKSYSNEPLKNVKVQLPENAFWVNAVDYKSLGYAQKFPQANLVYDGQRLGQQRADNAVNGSVVGRGGAEPPFGANKGDSLVYELNLQKINAPVIIFRYRVDNGKSCTLEFSGAITKNLTLNGNGDFQTLNIDAGLLNTKQTKLTIRSTGGNAIDINGFAVVDKSNVNNVKFTSVPFNYKPEIIELTTNHIILKYKDVDDYYAIMWDYPSFVHRNWSMNSIDEEMRKDMNKFNADFYWKTEYKADGEEFFDNLFSNLIIVSPNSSKVLNFVVSSGTLPDLKNKMNQFDPQKLQSDYILQKSKALSQQYNSAGLKYAFSQQLMAAVTLTNVVYPVFTQNSFIKHNTPGRMWDCLYTWDSGFIGLGLSKLNQGRAFECLNAYTMKLDDQSAFLHHGTPLPVQAYLFLELWNETQNKEMLNYLYPRMKRYYDFLVGDSDNSTTRNLASNLIRTWDYFYNSGGWDDYPPQVYTHSAKLESKVAPMVNTSHVIRMAKILTMAAKELNLNNDQNKYQSDIKMLTAAIQKYAWDEQSGYFGYVMHDENGESTGILKTENGVNFNMGLDGCSPLISGICNENQIAAITKNLFAPGKIWSVQGLSTVDQTAPYYLENGYWNGSVWMPHQWFFWKTMLDLGKQDEALRIAKTGLEVWKRETEATYNCNEVFPIKSGRSGGWHQFGGLSTPVIMWYSAMYKPGTFTVGYDTWVKQSEWKDNFSAFSSQIVVNGKKGDKKTMWICMNENYKYNFFWNDKSLKAVEVEKGFWSVELICSAEANRGVFSCKVN